MSVPCHFPWRPALVKHPGSRQGSSHRLRRGGKASHQGSRRQLPPLRDESALQVEEKSHQSLGVTERGAEGQGTDELPRLTPTSGTAAVSSSRCEGSRWRPVSSDHREDASRPATSRESLHTGHGQSSPARSRPATTSHVSCSSRAGGRRPRTSPVRKGIASRGGRKHASKHSQQQERGGTKSPPKSPKKPSSARRHPEKDIDLHTASSDSLRTLKSNEPGSLADLGSVLDPCNSMEERFKPYPLDKNVKAHLQRLRQIFREELSSCSSHREVEQFAMTAGRFVGASTAELFSMTGRINFRLREVMRSLRSSSFVAMDPYHRRLFQRILRSELQRRTEELDQWTQKRDTLKVMPGSLLPGVVCARVGMRRAMSTVGSVTVGKRSGRAGGISLGRAGADFSDADEGINEAGGGGGASATTPMGSPTRQRTAVGDFDGVAAMMGADEAGNIETKALDEEAWYRVFHKLKDDGSLHHDDLPHALELCGYSNPDPACIEEAFFQITKFTTIGEGQFFEFVRMYLDRLDKMYTAAFVMSDKDSSGAVDIPELIELLKGFGIEPLPCILDALIKEVSEDDDPDSLSLQEFKKVMELLRVREGFLREEVEGFFDLFEKFDRDQSDEIDTREFHAALVYLGYGFSRDVVTDIVNEVDHNRSGTLSKREFLVSMRKIREREIAAMQDIIKREDTDGSGTVNVAELVRVFKALGYVAVDPQAISEACEAAGIETGVELGLNEMWKLLLVFRSRDGLLEDEAHEIEAAFMRYANSGDADGEIGTLQIGKVLRFIGYPTPFEVQQQLAARVDIDGSGRLSLQELRKLIRIHRESEIDLARRAFWMGGDPDTLAPITREDAVLALKTLGLGISDKSAPKSSPSPVSGGGMAKRGSMLRGRGGGSAVSRKSLHPATADGGHVVLDEFPSLVADDRGMVDVDNFLRCFLDLKRASRRIFRENGGFTTEETQELRRCFQYYDKDGSGDINNGELILVIEEVFPKMAHDRNMRPTLVQLMKEIDADGNGSLDFQDFLRLMQQLQDLQLKERCAKESQVVTDTGFTHSQVEEFRELFLADAEDAALSGHALRSMLRTVFPLGDRHLTELGMAIEDVTGAPCPRSHDFPKLDFPEFLLLMRKLLDIDFAQMSRRTANAARTQ